MMPILICDSREEFMPFYALKKFLNIFDVLREIVFIIFKVKLWTPKVMKDYEILKERLITLLTEDSFSNLSPSKMRFIKVHMLHHFPYFVKWYGSPMNFDAGKSKTCLLKF